VSGAHIDEPSRYLHKIVVDAISLQKKKSGEGKLSVDDQRTLCSKVLVTLMALVEEFQLPAAVYGDIFQFHIYAVKKIVQTLRKFR
jgi:hypothetical protein